MPPRPRGVYMETHNSDVNNNNNLFVTTEAHDVAELDNHLRNEEMLNDRI